MNIRYIKLISIVLFLLILTGCAANLYMWEDYSKTKYRMRKDNTEQASQKYMNSLQSIIRNAESSGKNVPPGVYCELGQIYQQNGFTEKAINCFNNEKNQYPESATFVDLLLKQISDNIETEKGENNE